MKKRRGLGEVATAKATLKTVPQCAGTLQERVTSEVSALSAEPATSTGGETKQTHGANPKEGGALASESGVSERALTIVLSG